MADASKPTLSPNRVATEKAQANLTDFGKLIITDDRVSEYVGKKCGIKFHQPFTALGIEHDGDIIAGAIFNDFNGFDIELSVAGEKNAFTRTFIRRIGDYVFHELGCLRASFTTRHEHVVELLHRLGARTEGLKRNHFGVGIHGIVIGLLREEWRLK